MFETPTTTIHNYPILFQSKEKNLKSLFFDVILKLTPASKTMKENNLSHCTF